MTDVAEVLAAHWVAMMNGGCRCGWKIDLTDATRVSQQHSAHVAEQIQPLIDAEKQRAVEEALDEVEVRQAWVRERGTPPTDPAAYEAWRTEHVAARDEMRAQVREARRRTSTEEGS